MNTHVKRLTLAVTSLLATSPLLVSANTDHHQVSEQASDNTHDVQVQWQPAAVAKQALRLTAALENIFDTRYADHASVRIAQNGQEFTTLDAGRNLRLSAEWQF